MYPQNVSIKKMLAFRLFSCHISGMQSFQENRLFYFHAFVALKLLVSLIGRLVACTARISVDRSRQTDGQTNHYCTCHMNSECVLESKDIPTAGNKLNPISVLLQCSCVGYVQYYSDYNLLWTVSF